MRYPYVVQDAYGTKCPKGHGGIAMLVREDGETHIAPSFYICFACRWVGRIGGGEVKNLLSPGRKKIQEYARQDREIQSFWRNYED